jgi:septum site-determining protein MinD
MLTNPKRSPSNLTGSVGAGALAAATTAAKNTKDAARPGEKKDEMTSNTSTENSSPRFIAILSGKGGTGKSIITASMGCLLARCGFKTLLVDVDLFTGGLTFYCLAAYPRNIDYALQELFLAPRPDEYSSPRNGPPDGSFPRSLAVPNEFARGNLFLLPAHSRRVRPKSELALSPKFRDVSSFAISLAQGLEATQKDQKFDYILLDTRGGTDVTSVSTALVAGAYILVTEADKTSWDVGEVLLRTVDEQSEINRMGAQMLGFVINKNVLPPDAIVAFLRQRWNAPHLATIPLDGDAIRCYQEDKIPVADNISSLFSTSLVPIIRKLFLSESWPPNSLAELLKIEDEAKQAETARLTTKETIVRSEKLSVFLRIYGTAISTLLLCLLVVNGFTREVSPFQVLSAVTAAVLIFVMTGSDPKVIETLVAAARGRSNRLSREETPPPTAVAPSEPPLIVTKRKRPVRRGAKKPQEDSSAEEIEVKEKRDEWESDAK